jgi:hypothetical protein
MKNPQLIIGNGERLTASPQDRELNKVSAFTNVVQRSLARAIRQEKRTKGIKLKRRQTSVCK